LHNKPALEEAPHASEMGPTEHLGLVMSPGGNRSLGMMMDGYRFEGPSCRHPDHSVGGLGKKGRSFNRWWRLLHLARTCRFPRFMHWCWTILDSLWAAIPSNGKSWFPATLERARGCSDRQGVSQKEQAAVSLAIQGNNGGGRWSKTCLRRTAVPVC